jgi:ATP-binding cassette subfamily B protein
LGGKHLIEKNKNNVQNRFLLRRIFVENFQHQWRYYGVAIFFMLITALMTSASALVMRDVIDCMVPGANKAHLFFTSGMIALIFMTKGVSTYIQGVFLSKAGNSIIAEQQRKIFDHILKSDFAFIQSWQSSDLLMRVTHGAQSARSVIDTIVVSFVRDLFTLLGLLSVMAIQHPLFSLIALVLGPLAFLGVRKLLFKVRQIMEMELASLAQIVRIVQETSVGFRVVLSYSLENLLRKDLDEVISCVQKRTNAMTRIESATSPLMETLAGLAIAGIISFVAVIAHKDQTVGGLASFITALLLAYEPAKRLARMRVSIEAGMVGVRKLFKILDYPTVLKEKPDAKDLAKGPGRVAFENVCFAYTQDQRVLKNLTLAFESGKITALVGPSGAGKSTLINLIMRLYDPSEGVVRVDGHNIADVTFASLRSQIAYVGQDVFLFSGTVLYNIGLGKEGATEQDIIQAAKAANAHEFILALPNGYHTSIGENGCHLSGGQRQKLTIARAFLKNAQILILDEATSALDGESEASIRSAVEALARGRTSIIIAHRLSTVMCADHIIVLDAGVILEEGTPNQLIQNKGLFHHLYRYQILPEVG